MPHAKSSQPITPSPQALARAGPPKAQKTLTQMRITRKPELDISQRSQKRAGNSAAKASGGQTWQQRNDALLARNAAFNTQRRARQDAIASRARQAGSGGSGISAGRSYSTVTPNAPSAGVLYGMGNLVSQFNKQREEANVENEKRYAEMLGFAGQDIGGQEAVGVYGEAQGIIDAGGERGAGTAKNINEMLALARRRTVQEMGRGDSAYRQALNIQRASTEQRSADIRQDFANLESGQMQNLARTGMANTTVGNSLRAGNQRGMQAELNRSAYDAAQIETGLLERRAASLNQLSEADANRRIGIMERGRGDLSKVAFEQQQQRLGALDRRYKDRRTAAERKQQQLIAITGARIDQGPSSEALMNIIGGIGATYGGGQANRAVLSALGGIR